MTDANMTEKNRFIQKEHSQQQQILTYRQAESSGALENANCISAEG